MSVSRRTAVSTVRAVAAVQSALSAGPVEAARAARAILARAVGAAEVADPGDALRVLDEVLDVAGQAVALAAWHVPDGLRRGLSVADAVDVYAARVRRGLRRAEHGQGSVWPVLPAATVAPGRAEDAAPCPSPAPDADRPSVASDGPPEGPSLGRVLADRAWSRALAAWRGDGGVRLYGPDGSVSGGPSTEDTGAAGGGRDQGDCDAPAGAPVVRRRPERSARARLTRDGDGGRP